MPEGGGGSSIDAPGESRLRGGVKGKVGLEPARKGEEKRKITREKAREGRLIEK